jgi:hypothetical protein
MSWRDRAQCFGVELPWLRPHDATDSERAQMLNVCRTCPVREACEADMHEHLDYIGVRAGVVWRTPNGDTSRGRPARDRILVCQWCQSAYSPAKEARNSRFCSRPCRYKSDRQAARDADARRRANRREVS